MRDVVYVGVSVAFFGLMIAYVAWCERFGRGAGAREDRP